MIGREHIFRALARNEITQLLSGIGDPRDSEQMALLADAVASGWFEFRGIHDIAGARIGKMFLRRTVTAFAGDRFRSRGEYRKAVFVQRFGDVQRGPGMAEDTFIADRAREIGIGLIFVAGREIVRLAVLVISNRRLEQVTADVHQIAARVISGTDHPVNAVFTLVAAIFPTLPESRGG